MIICTRQQLEQRCEERGRSITDVGECIISSAGSVLYVDETHASYPRPRHGLGDMVASGLSAIGITKERVSAVVGRDCGCPQRQEALNEFGRKIGIG